MDSLIATARSNKVATCLRIQDFSQLRKDYGREQAAVIMNITVNIISGLVNGDTAKQLSERFGKIMQDRESLPINSGDTSINRCKQLESVIPLSQISSLSSVEFTRMIANDPDCKIELKTFHCEIVNNHEALRKEDENYIDIAEIRILDNAMVQRNYLQIKQDIQDIIHSEMELLLNNPGLAYLVVKK